MVDPGAFVRPGTAVATVIDRNNVRVTGEVPEGDFSVVGPGTPVRVHALAISRDFGAHISRRSPSADLATRTVHLEIDVPDPQRTMPVGTTAELTIEVGEPSPATEIPLIAASVRGPKATVFVVDGHSARKHVYSVKGERGGNLFLDASLPAGARVVTEGRALLQDGDRIEAKLEANENAAATTALAAGAKQ
jgi:RND family efflux transporter MFP subunit